jgi:hypothetical protein
MKVGMVLPEAGQQATRENIVQAAKQALKREFDENFDDKWVKDQIAECRKYNLHVEDRMFIVPVPFSIEGAKMLQHTKWLMEETEEDGSSLIAIDKSFDA